MSSADAADTDPLIGHRIDGRYTVHHVLGAGGMGVVYEGVHDDLGRTVAIKVLNAAWASDRTAVERFLREARTASSFSHPNIVDVTDLGRLPDGRPFLVMPKITGVDLATLLGETGPQPAKRVAALLSGVAAALDLVHAKGFVHRDIKPENLMYVVREDGSETVMLLDFGIAAAVMSSGPRLTRQGAIFGTPHYLPPEVCAGARPDARGDVYALAAVAYELITGALPFPLEDIMQLMAYKVTHDPPTLAAATGFEFPPELEQVVARGMAREPQQRFASASAFVNALHGATVHAPVSWQSGVLRSTMRSDEHFVPRERPWVEHAPTMPSEPVHRTPGSLRPANEPYRREPTPNSNYAPEPRVGTGGRGFDREPGAPRYDREPSGGRGFDREPGAPRYDREPSGQRYDREPSAGRAFDREPSAPGFEREPGSARLQRDFGHESSRAAPGRDPSFDRRRSSQGYRTEYGASDAEYTQRLRVLDERRYPTATVPMKTPWGRYLLYFAAGAVVVLTLAQLKWSKRHVASTTSQSAATAAKRVPAAIANDAPAAKLRARAAAPATGSATAAPGAALASGAAPASAPSAASATSAAPAGIAPAVAAAANGPWHTATTVQPANTTNGAAPGANVNGAFTAPSAPVPPPIVPAPWQPRAAASQPSAAAASAPAYRPGEPSAARAPSYVPAPEPPPPPSLEPSVSGPVVMLKEEPAPEEPAAPAKPTPAPAPEKNVGVARAAQLTRDASSALLRGEVGRAVELSRAATVSDEDNARAWRTLGLALERTGSSREATAAYRHYLLLSPSGPEADMIRQRIQSLGE